MNVKLSLEQQAQFKAALEYYYSSSDDSAAENFFHHCARALIRTHQAGESVEAPLRFQTAEFMAGVD
jgi:hypothetical protein